MGVQVEDSVHRLPHQPPGFLLSQWLCMRLEVALKFPFVAHLQHQVHVVPVFKEVVQLGVDIDYYILKCKKEIYLNPFTQHEQPLRLTDTLPQ